MFYMCCLIYNGKVVERAYSSLYIYIILDLAGDIYSQACS